MNDTTQRPAIDLAAIRAAAGRILGAATLMRYEEVLATIADQRHVCSALITATEVALQGELDKTTQAQIARARNIMNMSVGMGLQSADTACRAIAGAVHEMADTYEMVR